MENPPPAHVDERASSAAPRTPTENALIEIWCAILKADGIGVHDDFLELGGDSLSATRCANRIRTVFDVDIPLESFFADAAHIVAIASLIDRRQRERAVRP
jgi:acyl carrier protein